MKTLLILTLLLLPSLTLAYFDTNLTYGSTGPKVIELQDFLRVQGLFNETSTGNFYTLTKNAVIAFQVRENITPAIGNFYALTRARANELNIPPPPPPPLCTFPPNTVKYNDIDYSIDNIIEGGVDWGAKTLQINYSST